MRADHLRRRSFAVRYAALFAGEVASKLLVLAAFAYLARALGPRDFGTMELALSLAVLFVLAVEIGLGSYGARVIETAPDRAGALVPRAGALRLVLALPAYLLILALSTSLPGDGRSLLALYGLLVLLTPFNTQWVFQGLRQMQWVAAGNVLRFGTFALAVAVLIRPGSDVRLVAVAELLGAAALASFNAAVLHRTLGFRPDWRDLLSGVAKLFRQTWYLGGSDLMWMAMWLSPAIVVGWIESAATEQVAWIASAVRIVMALHTFVWLYFFNLLPNLSRELHDGLDGWRALVRRSFTVSVLPTCLLALAGTLLASVAMTTVFGSEYGPAVRPFQIIIWMIPVACVSGHFRYSLIAAGRQDREFVASAAGGLVAVGVTLVAAPHLGASGAAAALLAGGIVNGMTAGVLMVRTIGRP